MTHESIAHEKDEAAHHEVSEQKSQKGKLRRICGRFWWLYFLLFVIIVLAVVLPIIYVAYPKVARRAADRSTLQVTSMTIQNPTPDSVELGFTQMVNNPTKYEPTLYPFNASFYMLDNADNPPFASIRTPKITKAANGTESEVPLQRVNITHMDEFTRYVLLALGSEEFTVALRGHGGLSTSSLPKTNVNYDKNITLKGFDGLKNFGLLSFNTLNTTEPDGTNAVGVAAIFNPTVMTLNLGNVTLAMSVNGTDIGVATLNNLVLVPGLQQVDLRAEVYQLVAVGIVLERQNPVLPVDLKGGNSTVDGQQIPYYTTMLQEVALQMDIDVTKAMEGS
ncbi:hypothetical protein OHC33_010161 [Knufia fluminis]|uniref:Uncharacterized protein n=1 Tax=Knufia fluminis TaxID=191047 RepID=A0AAN8E966_9EURO|nr:hypothetical protein OHC33_010161 [Knufia fluminis]